MSLQSYRSSSFSQPLQMTLTLVVILKTYCVIYLKKKKKKQKISQTLLFFIKVEFKRNQNHCKKDVFEQFQFWVAQTETRSRFQKSGTMLKYIPIFLRFFAPRAFCIVFDSWNKNVISDIYWLDKLFKVK